MVSMRNLALAASSIIGLTSAAPTELNSRQYTQNTTQDFYIALQTTNENHTNFNGYQLATYHTGAGLADPVFIPAPGTPAFLNTTQLQFDIASPSPFSLSASGGDTNYARWEPTSIGISYGTQGFIMNGTEGIVIESETFGGWLVCEWYHGLNAPQLFQLISVYDEPVGVYPSSCFEATLVPEYI